MPRRHGDVEVGRGAAVANGFPVDTRRVQCLLGIRHESAVGVDVADDEQDGRRVRLGHRCVALGEWRGGGVEVWRHRHRHGPCLVAEQHGVAGGAPEANDGGLRTLEAVVGHRCHQLRVEVAGRVGDCLGDEHTHGPTLLRGELVHQGLLRGAKLGSSYHRRARARAVHLPGGRGGREDNQRREGHQAAGSGGAHVWTGT
mmetsp:Transcript_7156/g.18502  ORF Transcript_7156/g.18502 Transcript_7156/m.18502 type:complete len:200 (-) Transcript_7156:124-723(-)